MNTVRKRVLIAALVGLAVLLALGVGALVLYRASQQVPQFYQQALEAAPKANEEASNEMLQLATALASDVRKEGKWQAVVTAEQINGWLAVDMVRNHRDLLPSSLSDPRVAIQPERVMIACRLDRGNWKCVVSLVVDVYLVEPDVVALRIREAKAGALPLPLQGILDGISEQADYTDVDVRWRQAEGDPVMEIAIPPPRDAKGRAIRIETLQLGDGKIYLSGVTERR